MSALPAISLPPRGLEASRRVLFVHQSSELYGSDRVLLDIAGDLQRRGGEAIVALPTGGPLVQALAARGVEVHVLDPMRVLKLSRSVMSASGMWRLMRSVPQAMASLDRIVAGRVVDAVHSNTLAVMAGALWARRMQRPHLWHVHEIVEHPRLAMMAFPRLVKRYADRVLCNSGATLHWLLRHQPSLAPRSEVLHNGVADKTQPCSELMRQAFRPCAQRLAIGLVGRINRMKGHKLLIDAAERLARRGVREFSLVFIGDPPPEQEHHLHDLRECIERSPIGKRVVCVGFMSDLGAAYSALDVLCVPSTEAESFGIVAVEAMAAGLPVVAARIGGLPEVVEDGVTGLLHAPGDAADLAEQLALLIEDDEWRMQLGQAGRRRFEERFRIESMTERFAQALASTCRAAA
jgi:glycosyltransferase involved in cell wall biosynthesis